MCKCIHIYTSRRDPLQGQSRSSKIPRLEDATIKISRMSFCFGWQEVEQEYLCKRLTNKSHQNQSTQALRTQSVTTSRAQDNGAHTSRYNDFCTPQYFSNSLKLSNSMPHIMHKCTILFLVACTPRMSTHCI